MTLKKRCNAQSASMRNLFDRWERKPNQTISHNEFFDTMRMANLGGVSRASGTRLVRALDPADSGGIEYTRFRDALRSAPSAAPPRPRTVPVDSWRARGPKRAPRALFCGKKLRQRVRSKTSELSTAFKNYDVNNDGWLSKPEFAALLDNSGLGLTELDLDVMAREADAGGDGKIQYEEFVNYLGPPKLRPDPNRAVSLFDAPEGFINQPKYELRDRMLARRIHQPRYVKYGSVGGDAVLAPGQKREQLHAVTAKVGGEFVKRKMRREEPGSGPAKVGHGYAIAGLSHRL